MKKRMKKAISEVDELTGRVKKVDQYQCLKSKAILQNRKTRRGEMLTINNQDIEVVRISRYFRSCNQ